MHNEDDAQLLHSFTGADVTTALVGRSDDSFSLTLGVGSGPSALTLRLQHVHSLPDFGDLFAARSVTVSDAGVSQREFGRYILHLLGEASQTVFADNLSVSDPNSVREFASLAVPGWEITYIDQSLYSQDWELKEDLLQLEHAQLGRLADLGWYRDHFTIHVFQGDFHGQPLCERRAHDQASALKALSDSIQAFST